MSINLEWSNCRHCGEPMSSSPFLEGLCDKCVISAGFVRELHESLIERAKGLLDGPPLTSVLEEE